MVKNEQIGIAENAERGGPEVDRRRHFESDRNTGKRTRPHVEFSMRTGKTGDITAA